MPRVFLSNIEQIAMFSRSGGKPGLPRCTAKQMENGCDSRRLIFWPGLARRLLKGRQRTEGTSEVQMGRMAVEQTVLVVESDSERGRKLEVLLRIAGYRTVSFAAIEEAINWSTACARQGQEVCLLNSAPGPVLELAALLQKIRQCHIELPVLLVNRDLPALATRPEARRQLAAIGVHICDPTEICEALLGIFTRQGWLPTAGACDASPLQESRS